MMITISAAMGAIAILIGGSLLFSQILTPVLFYYFEMLQEKLFAYIESHKKKTE